MSDYIKASRVVVHFTCPVTNQKEKVEPYDFDIGKDWYDRWDSYEKIEFYCKCLACEQTHLIRIKGGY